MTNTEMLRALIKQKGYKIGFIADKIGIAPWSLTRKMKNESEFTQSEIDIICKLLEIKSLREKEAIFFA